LVVFNFMDNCYQVSIIWTNEAQTWRKCVREGQSEPKSSRESQWEPKCEPQRAIENQLEPERATESRRQPERAIVSQGELTSGDNEMEIGSQTKESQRAS